MAMLFQAASSPGGARPKVLVHDSNGSYLAKFASTKDIFDVVALEAATMHLADSAGLYVAKTICSPCGPRQALLVNRFDMDQTTRKRYHCISMQSLLRADGYYNLSYADMATILKKTSEDPIRDQLNLFRQMVFNVLIGNTDDHLKNFTMIHADNGWQLSPAYDLIPNIGLNSEHVLRIGLDTRVPNRKTLISEARRFGLKQIKKIEEEIDNIIAAVANWREIFNNFEVPEEDILRLGKDIENRLAICSDSRT